MGFTYPAKSRSAGPNMTMPKVAKTNERSTEGPKVTPGGNAKLNRGTGTKATGRGAGLGMAKPGKR